MRTSIVEFAAVAAKICRLAVLGARLRLRRGTAKRCNRGVSVYFNSDFTLSIRSEWQLCVAAPAKLMSSVFRCNRKSL